jgi:predicted GH43/DUF377 family glycosyl hydrolase
MQPEPGNPQRIDGVLNPAAACGPDGQFYLFQRLVARGNCSRIGISRVRFNEPGDPAGIERLGIALQPEADYELRPGGGGCEDSRITFKEPLQRYIMTYAAFSPQGPRIVFVMSVDLCRWRRLGLAAFANYHGIEIGDVDNKAASLFPGAIPNRNGRPDIAMPHRPLSSGTRPKETARGPATRDVDLDRESIWISYCPRPAEDPQPYRLGPFASHQRLATPVSPWERLKIGGRTPPVMTSLGWLIVYHGVSEAPEAGNVAHQLCYSAGVMVLSKQHPRVISYRSAEPALTPTLSQQRSTVANVVFPTGIDRRDDLGMPDRFDVYYGMADNRIGVPRLDLPDSLPPEGAATPSEAKV